MLNRWSKLYVEKWGDTVETKPPNAPAWNQFAKRGIDVTILMNVILVESDTGEFPSN
jgi:hypothetical protein